MEIKQNGQKTETKRWSFRLLKHLLLDLPLFLLVVALLLVFMVRTIHETYYKPLYDRAERTDEDLYEEYTYYYRTCNEYDLTTQNAQDLFLGNSTTTQETVQQLLRHGGLIFPEILEPRTVQELRSYIVSRNARVTDAEAFPVSQGENRLSYGIDATEHHAVSNAISEITNNTRFRALLQQLLGDYDPASAEITAITAYAGCPPQAWHMDTKSDGNALKFARTYSHSYSFFLPLQDTTAEMGATDVCPGTHYCGNEMDVVCEERGISLGHVYPQGFRAGDGFLANQHVWHRGGEHTDENALERIVFILSFLARPKLQDPRQLSRGTYFHQKWNMWGHTVSDLMNPVASMRKPWSILRCMGLFKPQGCMYFLLCVLSRSLSHSHSHTTISRRQLGLRSHDLWFYALFQRPARVH
jgi:hypothetical protein